MADINWFRRGDGAEFAVPAGSQAEANLIAAGALHVEGPGAASSTVGGFDPQSAEDLARGTKAEILAWAEAQGLVVALTKTDRHDAIVAAVSAAIDAKKAEEAAASGGT